MQILGGRVPLKWSMRTGELQAPVGYDCWGYGICDINSSRIHYSKRNDSWADREIASFGHGVHIKPTSSCSFVLKLCTYLYYSATLFLQEYNI